MWLEDWSHRVRDDTQNNDRSNLGCTLFQSITMMMHERSSLWSCCKLCQGDKHRGSQTEKGTFQERFKNTHTDSIQNRFTSWPFRSAAQQASFGELFLFLCSCFEEYTLFYPSPRVCTADSSVFCHGFHGRRKRETMDMKRFNTNICPPKKKHSHSSSHWPSTKANYFEHASWNHPSKIRASCHFFQ